jgi:hypothetical protein
MQPGSAHLRLWFSASQVTIDLAPSGNAEAFLPAITSAMSRNIIIEETPSDSRNATVVTVSVVSGHALL